MDRHTSTGTETGSGEDVATVTRVYRRLSPYGSRPNAGMDGIGWAIFLGILVLLVPLLPLLVVVWLVGRLLDAVAGRRGVAVARSADEPVGATRDATPGR